MPKINRVGKAEVISVEVLGKILKDECINLKHRALMATLFFTAGRIGEVCQIKLAEIGTHISFAKSTTKMKKTRQVLVHFSLREILDEYIKTLPRTQLYLFSGREKNTYYSKVTADKILSKIFALYGLHGCSTHSFRRSVLTHCHQSGASLADLQQLSGHSSLTSLQQYLQSSDNAQSKVLGLIKF